ncbi:MAG TPA: hypothetical protein VD710_10760 [Nitrososphaeraceae archaeon]|nr:hypothetical protein [Nitrososphaeraceae archaeon]
MSTFGVFVKYTFGTAETNQPEFNFVAAGDFGCGKNANRTITNMLLREPEVVIGLGTYRIKKLQTVGFTLFLH